MNIEEKILNELSNFSKKQDLMLEEQKEMKETLKQTQNRVDELSAKVDDNTKQIDALNIKVDELSDKVDDNTKQIDILSAKVDDNTKQIDTLNIKVNELSDKVDDNAEQIDALTTKVIDNTEQINKLASLRLIDSNNIAKILLEQAKMNKKLDDSIKRYDSYNNKIDIHFNKLYNSDRLNTIEHEEFEVRLSHLEKLKKVQ